MIVQTYREHRQTAAKAYLCQLIEQCGGNVSKAARVARMDRAYLHKLLARYGIEHNRAKVGSWGL